MDGREGAERSMADGMALPRVITSELLLTNAFRTYEGKSSELIPPDPPSRVCTIQLNWASSTHAQNVAWLLFRGRKALLCVLECNTSRKEWETLHQQEERERRALAKSILQVSEGEAAEVGNQGDDRGR